MVNQGKRTDEHKSVFGNRKASPGDAASTADWRTANTAKVVALIGVCTSRGGAVRFGYTRDGGAYALGLYYGSESNTVYCRPSEDLDSFLDEWIEFYEALPMSNGVSPDAGKKGR